MELLRRISFTLLFLSLIGCGGGSLEQGGDITPPDVSTTLVVLSLSNTTVTGAEPVSVYALVTDDGAPVVGTVVSFKTNLGTFIPSAGTALTNSDGIAEITLTAGTVRGASMIVGSLSTGEEGEIGFTTQGDDIGVVGDISISLALVDVNGNPTDNITASRPGRVIASIDGINNPIIVSFSSTVGDIPIANAVTDDENIAIVDIAAGENLGAGTVTASIESGEKGSLIVVVGSSNVKMGSGSGSAFVDKTAEVSLNEISAGGTTVVSVSIVDDQNVLFTEPVSVNFSSRCSALATPQATLSSPITTSNGIATSTYLAKGCVDADPISVTANAGGVNLLATTSVNVLKADVGSIEFIEASPENIAIVGTGSQGGSESSTVKFRVLDEDGNPVNNQVVDFELNTDVGGVSMSQSSATSNNIGVVQTVIRSGTVATSLRIKASTTSGVTGQVISSQSSLLVVSTGIPDQDSFSLSASILNAEGWSTDGTEVVVTARLADAFNNPVPDGTAVTFTTEGGAIDPSCVTKSGTCNVTWRSQNPRPEGHVLGEGVYVLHPPEVENTMGQKYGGRATILATAIGEESFPDLNGNARFDADEMAAFAGNNISGLPYDLKEAFVDHNEDGFYNPDATENALAPLDPNDSDSGVLEEFADFNVDTMFTQNDGLYNGVLCSEPAHAGCADTQKSLNVRGSLTIVMSGSEANLCVKSTSDNATSTADLIRVDQGLVESVLTLDLPVSGTSIDPTDDAIIIARHNNLCHAEVLRVSYDDDDDASTPDVEADVINNSYDNAIYIQGENSASASVIIADLHNQPMPAGTTVTFTATAGSVVGPSEFIWPNDNHNGGLAFGVTVKGETEPKSGSLIVEIETPGGLSTVYSDIAIVIQ